MKTLEYYLKLPYTIQIHPSPEGGYAVSILELPGCISQGETVQEALEMIEDAKAAWIETALARGMEVPEPQRLEEFSGKLVVRMPKSLHKKLSEQAKRENVSLNQYIVYHLAHSLS